MKNFRRGTAVLAVTALVGLALAACGAGKDGGGGSRSPHRRHHRQGRLDRSRRLVRQRLAQCADAGLPVPAQLRRGQHRAHTRRRREVRLHQARRVHLHDEGRTEVRQRPRAHRIRRRVLLQAHRRHRRPQRPGLPARRDESVEATDDKTVVFTLKGENDQTFPQILVTSAGPIVDEETYPADKVLDDEAAVKANGFSGPYTIAKYDKNQLAEFKANPDYDGTYGKATEKAVTMKYYAKAENLKLDIKNEDIDVAYRSLTPTDIADLEKADGLKVYTGAGGELRYIVFNLKTMPGDDAEQKLAIRKAVASSVDREALSTEVYKDTFTRRTRSSRRARVPPSRSRTCTAHTPDKAKAEKFLERRRRQDPGDDQAAVQPGPLRLELRPGVRRDQASARGLRSVQGRPAVDGVGDVPGGVQGRRLPGVPARLVPGLPGRRQLPVAVPLRTKTSRRQLHALALQRERRTWDPTMSKLLDEQRTEADEAAREAKLKEIQDRLAEQVPSCRCSTGTQVAVARDGVKGARQDARRVVQVPLHLAVEEVTSKPDPSSSGGADSVQNWARPPRHKAR